MRPRSGFVVVALVSLVACKRPAPPPEPPGIRARVTDFLAAGERASAEMAKHEEKFDPKELDVDFGAKLRAHANWDADRHLGCRFSTLDRQGKTIIAIAACWNLEGTVRLDPAPPGVEETHVRNETVRTWRSEAGLAAYRDAIAAVLGPVVAPSPPLEGASKDDYATLTDPMPDANVFGTLCTLPTAGGPASMRLLQAGRLDALRASARGPSPAGRLHAIVALTDVPKPAKEDLDLRAKIESLPGLVPVCGPNGLSEKPAAVALPKRITR